MNVRFGTWTFDADRRLVVRDDGGVVHLTPKAFDVLAMLIEHAPSVVRKSHLHERIWPGTFVSDATLVGLIKELRRAFEDRDRSAPLIRTSHGVGYAFGGAIERQMAPASRSPSIAVLPFTSIGDDPKDAPFSDGLAEELTTALGRLPGLRVAAWPSAFHVRHHARDPQQIGKILGVDHVLEGGVLRVGDRVRVTARLVNVANGLHLWSGRHDGVMGDVFAVQDDISASIANALALTLAGRMPAPERRHTQNPEAFEFYLRGRHCWHQRTPESLHTAIAHFEAAVRLDGDYALAYAGLANAYSVLAFYGYLPAADARSAAHAAAARALHLAPDRAESHYAMALFTMWLLPDWPDAERSYARALAIQADHAPAHTHYGALLAACHRFAEARRHVERAIALDPLSPSVHGTAALCMFTSGQYDEARRFGERALELQSNFVVALYALGLTYCRTGDFVRGYDAFVRLLGISNRAAYFLGWAALASGLGGRDAERRAFSAEIENRHPSEYVQPVVRLLAATADADRNAALRALEGCVAARGPTFQLAHVAPFLGGWADEPSFAVLLERLHVGHRN